MDAITKRRKIKQLLEYMPPTLLSEVYRNIRNRTASELYNSPLNYSVSLPFVSRESDLVSICCGIDLSYKIATFERPFAVCLLNSESWAV